MKRSIALLLGFILSISLLTGCNGRNNIELTGKYTLAAFEQDGEDVLTEMVDLLKEFGTNADDLEMYIEFQSGGIFKLVMYDEEKEGTFKVNGTTVTLTNDGDDTKGMIDGNRITIEENDPENGALKMVFEKE